MKIAIVATLTLICLIGCGQPGNLYLPTVPPLPTPPVNLLSTTNADLESDDQSVLPIDNNVQDNNTKSEATSAGYHFYLPK